MDSENVREVTRECLNCGNLTVQRLLSEAVQHDELELSDGEKYPAEYYYYFLQCRTCEGVSLYSDWEHDPFAGDLTVATQLYPLVRDLKGVPSAILDSYEEAKKILKRSPTAFAVLVGRSLEFLCKDKQAAGRNLKEQIDDLARRGIIPETLSHMAGKLRHFRNLGAHTSDIKISLNEAETMDEFFAAVLEYVYIAPEKLKKAEGLVGQPHDSSDD